MNNNRIDTAFEQLRQENRKGLFPFLVAGYPDMQSCSQIIHRLAEAGVAGIELGFPFSDSIADGPVIQTAFSNALQQGIKTSAIFEMIRQVRHNVEIPLLAMVSFSIVYRIGTEKFIDLAKQAGFDGFIIPDLSLEEAPAVADKILAAQMRLAMLIAPTTDPARQKKIAELTSGFVYYMSVTGITGERDKLPQQLPDNVQKLRKLSGKPVLVGFGIQSADQVRLVCSVADGAIVGSGFIRRINAAREQNQSPQQIVDQITDYAKDLLQGTS